MKPVLKFSAPWGTPLKLMTGLSVLTLVGIPLIGIFTGPIRLISKDTNSGVRSNTAESLGKLKDSAAIEALEAALDDKIRNVRISAERAIKQIKDAQ